MFVRSFVRNRIAQLVDVLNGQFDEHIDECVIIDSRYPYEYDGGHISTALNIYTREKLYEEMFIQKLHAKAGGVHKFGASYSCSCLTALSENDKAAAEAAATAAPSQSQETGAHSTVNAANSSNNKRTIIVFHCEFSSERGPGL